MLPQCHTDIGKQQQKHNTGIMMTSLCPSTVPGEWSMEYLREVACPKSEEGVSSQNGP